MKREEARFLIDASSTRPKFKDKVAVVTGSARGMGKGVAHEFAREGAKVVVNGRCSATVNEVVQEIKDYGGTAIGVACDIASSREVESLFAATVEAFGTVDILVNNAALTPMDAKSAKARAGFLELMTTPVPKRSLGVTREMTDEEWEHMIAVNLNGVFYCTRAALRVMEEKRYGKIINISSTAGISGLSFHSPHYSASKGAVVAFTRSVGLEVIGAGVNVNCVAAGGIATEAWNDFFQNADEAVRAGLMQAIPAGRLGTIKEFVSLVLYLASDDAAYVVGQTFSPNGGMVT
jgi:3-oxoacyl-[acyl-carrier protein] reductase